ncbi:MAG: anaerobic ribonucleoside-triphosphate reductase activating protein [Clostridia bacterium]|nr:anaerobic ribonucleoside-triphosphate reductase activating protein [Clostridia bacterium]
MLLLGLQKLTLLDFPEKMAATVFTGGCNFRCPFCHNASLVLGERVQSGEPISEEEFFAFLKKRQGILEGVCVSGGEPTLSPDLIPFLNNIKNMGYLVKLDTNGYRPDVLRRAIEAGVVDYVAMDIKSSREGYARAVGLDKIDVSKIEESAELLMRGNVNFEFRTTLVRELHGDEEIIAIGKWLSGAERYFLQTFRDSGDLISENFSGYDKNETVHLLKLLTPYIPNAQIRG